MAKAYSYIRFSTPEQAKGDSLRRQTDISERYALEHNLDLDTSLNFTDLGISAFDRSNITKGALGEFLKLIEDGKIAPGSHLLVESLDRLSRAQIIDALTVFLNIVRAGIVIVTLQDNKVYDSSSINDPMNLFYSLMVMSRASEESSTKSYRGKASWQEKKKNISQKRLTARCPYWMKASKGDTGFDLIEERAEVVRKIFQMAKDGIGNATITKRLNESQTPTFSKTANGWQESYIQKIFQSKAVYGDFEFVATNEGSKPETTVIEGYFPSVISKEEWTLVSNLRKSRRTRGGITKGKNLSNLFSGLLVCGYCGGSMTMGGHTKKGVKGNIKRRNYVGCSRARRGIGCIFRTWNYLDLENEILKYCNTVDFNQALGDTSSITKEIEVSKHNEIKCKIDQDEIQSKLENLVASLESLNETPKIIIKRISELEQKLDEAKKSQLEAEKRTQKLEMNFNTQTSQYEAFKKVINKLNTLTGNELHDFRIKLSSLIHQSISTIALYPNGPHETDENIKKKIAGLSEGFSKADIDQYIANINANSGRDNRYLTIVFKNSNSLLASKGRIIKRDEDTSGQHYSRSEYDDILQRK